MFTRSLSIIGAIVATTLSLNATTITAGAVTNGLTPEKGTISDSVVKIGIGGANCSGVMISPSWVLSASHCADIPLIGKVNTPEPIQPGINRDQGTYSATVHRHPTENPDMVLLNIDGVHQGTYAALPTRGANTGDVGYAVGFGGSGANIETAQAYDAVITQRYHRSAHGYSSEVIKSIPYNGELRQGDSGGPLFIDDEVHGVFSHGVLGANQVYRDNKSVSVSSYLDWIEETTGIDTVGSDTAASRTPSPRSTFGWSPSRPSTGYQNPMITDNGPNTNKTPTGQPSVSSVGSSS